MAGGGPMIGIDIGTTYTRAAVWHENRVQIIPNNVNELLTPSFVAFVDDEFVVGEAAKKQLTSNPENTFFDMKRLIGRRYSDKVVQDDMKLWPFKVVKGKRDQPLISVNRNGEEKTHSVTEIFSFLVKKMKENAETFLSEEVESVVISVPSYLSISQRHATKEACKIAGFKFVRMINDCSAAVLDYVKHKQLRTIDEKKVLIFELGGGAYAASIVTIDGLILEMKAVCGDTHLGSEDFDNRMVKYLVEEFQKKSNIDITTGNPKSLTRLQMEWEKAKIRLSSTSHVWIDIDCLHGDINFKIKITRAKFEELNIDLFQKCVESINKCLDGARMTMEDIDVVILLGRPTRIPKIQELLKKHFEGKELYDIINPDEAVARGVAIYGAVLQYRITDEYMDEVLALEITPMSMGINNEGKMEFVVNRYTTLPTKIQTQRRSTLDNQTKMLVEVYEGEGRLVKDNQLFGTFMIHGIPPAPAGSSYVELMFDIDPNFFLTVKAYDENSKLLVLTIEADMEDIGADIAEEAPDGPVIGIDLGTSNSCVTVWENGNVEVITDDEGNRIIPTCVAFTEDEMLFGETAKSQMTHNPCNTIFGMKRLIGRKFSDETVQNDMKLWPFKVEKGEEDEPVIIVEYKEEEKQYNSQAILSIVLQNLKKLAEKKLNKPIKDAVVTVPVYFCESQRRTMVNAAAAAELKIHRFITEPTAAAVAYTYKHNSTDKKKVLVFDLGGGTLDVSVLEMENFVVEVKSTEGDSHLGGEDFDRRMVEHFLGVFRKKEKVDITNIKKSINKLKEGCEYAKKILCVEKQTSTRLAIESLYKGIDLNEKIDRFEFETLNDDLFMKCLEPVERCLEHAKLKVNDVDEVILVGGSSRIPKIRALLQDYFKGKKLFDSLQPEEVVASGAAIVGAKLGGDKCDFVIEFHLKDVTPASIGLEMENGTMEFVIPRNTKIPTKKVISLPFSQSSPLALFVYEGERPMAKENHLLGHLDFPNVEPSSSGGCLLEVSFNVDINNAVQLTIKDPKNGGTIGKTFADNNGRLDRNRIAEMLRVNQKINSDQKEAENKRKAFNELEEYMISISKNVKDGMIKSRFGEYIYEILDIAVKKSMEWINSEGLKLAELECINRMKKDQEALFGSLELYKENVGLGIEEAPSGPVMGIESHPSDACTLASLGWENEDGTMKFFIARNTKIPTKKVITLPVIHSSTRSLFVYEGEKYIAKENHLLGSVDFPSVEPSGSDDYILEVAFNVDENKAVQVTIINTMNHANTGKTFVDDNGRLNASQIDEMLRKNEMIDSDQKEAQTKQVACNELSEYLKLVSIKLNDDMVKSRLGSYIQDIIDTATKRSMEWMSNEGLKADLNVIYKMKKDHEAVFVNFRKQIGL